MPDDVTTAGAAPEAAPAPTLFTATATTPAATTAPEGQQQATPAAADSGDWKAGLPEMFRTTPSLKTFVDTAKTPAEFQEMLASSYVSTKAMVGQRLEMPGEGADEKAIAAWRKVTGAPEKPEGYGSLKPEGFPEEFWNKESETKFLELAHKHHLPPAALKELAGLHAAEIQAGLQSAEAEHTAFLGQQMQELKTAWGARFDTNYAIAEAHIARIGLNPRNPALASAEVAQAMFRGACLNGEDRHVTTGEPAGAGGLSAQDIMDPKNTSMLARKYRGEFGGEAQMEAQGVLNTLLTAKK